MTELTKAQLGELQAVLDAYVENSYNKAAAASSLDMAASTYKDKLTKAQTLGLKPNAMAPDAEKRFSEMSYKYEAQIRDLKKQIRTMASERLDTEFVREHLFNVATYQPKVPEWVISPEQHGDGAPGTPTIFMSDWHYGEVVNPAEVDGINEYNISIANKRWERCIEKTVDLCFNHMTSANYKGIVFALGGDMVSGDIHEELAETNEGKTIEHVFGLFDLCVGAIDNLLEVFPAVFVPCAYGNHGRDGKWRMKSAAVTNFDWQLYCWLERYYKNDDRVTFSVPHSFDTRFKLHGWDYLLTHGDRLGARGGDGIIGVVGPIMRGVAKLKNTYAAQGKNIHYIMMGHWHQRISLQGVFVNGSGKGYDEYAMSSRFRPEIATQSLWWTHPSHGVTYEVPVFLEEQKPVTDKWIEVPS